MAKNRLYRVTTPTKTHLVEAPNPARAIAHVARQLIKVDIPASFEVFVMAKAGVEIEVVGDEPVTDETRSAVAQTLIPELEAA